MSATAEVTSLQAARLRWRAALLARVETDGHWEGELSTSALSTAVAVVALHKVDAEQHAERIRQGTVWLAEHANEDGGWGDTVRSQSNLSTTALCWGALKLCRVAGTEAALTQGEAWLADHLGNLDPDTVVGAILARYAEDRTFSVPILMMLAICGCLGKDEVAWQHLVPLPFELAALPRPALPG